MTDHVVVCISCGGPICLPQARYDYLRRSRKTFYCSAGHEQHFLGEEITPERFERLKAQLRDALDRAEDAQDEAWSFREVARTCPLGCGWTQHGKARLVETLRAALAGHLVEAHGARVERLRQLPVSTGGD